MSFRKHIFAVSWLLVACGSNEGMELDEGVATLGEALTTFPTNDGAPQVTVNGTHRDITTSDTQYYVLTTTGVKRVNHTAASSIPNAGLIKTIQLDRIDYVNSTWGLVGARSKNGNTPAQLVLKVDQASPRTVNLPAGVVDVLDLEARHNTSNLLDFFVMVADPNSSGFLVKSFRYNWSANTVTFQSQIVQDESTRAFTMQADTSYVVTSRTEDEYGYYLFRKANRSGAIGNVDENPNIVIDSYGNPATGLTDAISPHGYFHPSGVRPLRADRLDYGKYNGTSTYQFVSMNYDWSTNTYDIVTLDGSWVNFVRTPRDGAFNYWNGDSETLGSNNCYNYAGNRKTNNFAQPGYGSGQSMTSFSPAQVRAKAQADGLEYVGNQATGWPAVPEGKTLVAAISGLAPSYQSDYHWFRRNVAANGTVTWTHKPGGCNATNRKYPFTQAAAVVTDPRDKTTWDQSMYDTFVGFFLVDSHFESGKGVENINGSSWKRSSSGCGIYYPGQTATSTSSARSTGSNVTPYLIVSVGLYSGKENPDVVVDDPATIDEIRAVYAQTAQQGGTPDGISPGYMGLFVSNPCGLDGLPESFRLFTPPTPSAGGVAARTTPSALHQASSSLESNLLDLAAQTRAIDPALRSSIRTRVGK